MNTVMTTLLLCFVFCLFRSGQLEHIHGEDCAEDDKYVNLERAIYRLHVKQVNQDRTDREQIEDILGGNETQDSPTEDNKTYSTQENITEKNETEMVQTKLWFAKKKTNLVFVEKRAKNDSDLSAQTYSEQDNSTMPLEGADMDEVEIILSGNNSHKNATIVANAKPSNNITILTELVELKNETVEAVFREEFENITVPNSFSEYDNLTQLGEMEKSEIKVLPSNGEKNGTYEGEKLYSIGAANYTDVLIKQMSNNSYVEAIGLDSQGNLTQTVEKNSIKEVSNEIVQNATSVSDDPEYNRAILMLQEEIEMILNGTTNDYLP